MFIRALKKSKNVPVTFSRGSAPDPAGRNINTENNQKLWIIRTLTENIKHFW